VSKNVHNKLVSALTIIISETNGISLADTLTLLLSSDLKDTSPEAYAEVESFFSLLERFRANHITINELLRHPVSAALFEFFRNFPLKYNEEHIHLTGALTADFIYPRLKVLLDGPNKKIYEEKIAEVYGPDALPIRSVEDVDRLIRLQENEGFARYLKILYLPKLIFISREAHEAAAYHMASDLYHNYNIGKLRLKFSLSRASSSSSEQIPGIDDVTSEDVVLGLYDGFKRFQNEQPRFEFILSPSFRKEKAQFDADKYTSRKDHFMAQINEIVAMLEKYPFLVKHMTDVDTVGDERDLYRKEHFNELQSGFRKLQYRGFKIRSHHGETWYTLKKGIQAVDNAMNIWHIDTLEHGISLGINPNKYFHRIYQEILKLNKKSQAINEKHPLYRELVELDWGQNKFVADKLLAGTRLSSEEEILFVKAKFHTAREVEHYQHDVLNRMIQKGVTLVSLPSSNNKLTGKFEDYKEHPFSWWEKKGVQLGVGTDNHVTLNTNFINEMLILLYTDAENLKITKLLRVTTGETRRPYVSHLLWKMRKQLKENLK
jgi:adenosine deaminase